MKKILFLAFLNFIFIGAFSQNSYFMKAQIVKTDSSILSGLVKKTSESSLNDGVKFINSEEDKEVKQFPISEISQLIFLDDSSIFEKVKYENYISTNNNIKIKEFRLAKILVTGYANLYKLQLPEIEWKIIFETQNTFVYIVKIDSNYYVLDQKEKLEGPDYKLYKNYIGVLNYILRDYPELKTKIKNLKFNDKQIIPLIEKLNSQHSNISSKTAMTKETPIIYHGPNISYNKLNNYTNAEGSGYSVGYVASICLPEVNRHISTDFGLLIGKMYYTDLNNDKYNKLYFKVPIGVTYTFTNSKISPFLSFSMSPYFTTNSMEFFFGGAAGLTFNKKYLLSFSIDSKISQDEVVSLDNILQVNIGYRFNAKKTKTKK